MSNWMGTQKHYNHFSRKFAVCNLPGLSKVTKS
jgi:hypothetical protein